MHSTHIPPGIIQSHSDIPQTPPRHLPDTLQTPQNIAHFDQSKATRGKKEQTNKKCLIGCLSIACTPYPPDNIQIHSDNHQAPLRHFPDNLQTYRGTWERRNQPIKITLIGFMSINFTSYPHPAPLPASELLAPASSHVPSSASSGVHCIGWEGREGREGHAAM